jgi:ATPase family associated with various cellular activities (AAA)
MNIKEFKTVYPFLRKHNIIPYLHGKQGVGKTQTIKQIAKQLDLQLMCLNLATQEVGDLIGLLTRGVDGTVHHARPEWFPTEGQGIIFLDEINRAHPEVLQAMFPFVLDGTLHRHKLPSGWHVVVAGNYNSAEFTVTDMADAAWMSRFCHIDFVPTKEEFINYLEDKGAFTLAGFVRDNPEATTKKANSAFDALANVTPDNRILDIAIRPLETEDIDDSLRYELYCGCIGRTAASAYMSYKKSNEKSISARQILGDYKNVKPQIIEMTDPSNARFDSLSKSVDELIGLLETKPDYFKQNIEYSNLCEFALDLPNEMLDSFFDKINNMKVKEKSVLLNDVKMCELIANKLSITDKSKTKKKFKP